MGFLSWMKKSESKAPATPTSSVGGNPTPLQQLFAEWTHDRHLAKERDTTGREPESGDIKALPERAGKHRKPEVRKDRLKSRDIPF